MRLLNDLHRQAMAVSGPLAKAYGVALLVMAVAVFRAHQTQMPVVFLTRDPAAVAELSPFTGFLSNLGIVFWCFGAAVCFFGWGLLREHAPHPARFLFCSGAFTTWLMLDDLFQLHEAGFPRYLGTPQFAVYGFYCAIVLGYLAFFREDIARTEFGVLALALGLFAVSVVVDVATDYIPWLHELRGRALIEDGPKLLGILTWCLYFWRCASAYMATDQITLRQGPAVRVEGRTR
jgi:hypothetical protein